MYKMMKQGGSNVQHFSLGPDSRRVSWDDIRIFMDCAEYPSFRRAAEKLGISNSTISRAINNLETSLGVNLIIKKSDGMELTNEGREILEYAKRMDEGFSEIARCGMMKPDNDLAGPVGISVTEGLGAYWLSKKNPEFKKVAPRIRIDLYSAMESVNVAKMEADVAIRFSPPENKDLICRKLGYLHAYPFAGQPYIDLYGAPKNDDDLCNHSFIQQVAPQLEDDDFFKYFSYDIEKNIGMRTNSSSTHYEAIASGNGIGVLPTYICASGALPVVPIDIEGKTSYRLEVFMTYHKDVLKVSRKQMVIDWIKDIFDRKENPWFKKEFMHPNDIYKYLGKDIPYS